MEPLANTENMTMLEKLNYINELAEQGYFFNLVQEPEEQLNDIQTEESLHPFYGNSGWMVDFHLALKEKYNIGLEIDDKWGTFNEYVVKDGYNYYYKPHIEEIKSEFLAPPTEEEVELVKNSASALLATGWDFEARIDSNDLFSIAPTGLPKLIEETDVLIKTESVDENPVTIDNITRETLDIIQNSFPDNIHPLGANVGVGMFIKDNKAYYTGVMGWRNAPNFKYGVFMDVDEPSEKYNTDKNVAFFFPFKQLTEQELEMLNSYFYFTMQYDTVETKIVYL